MPVSFLEQRWRLPRLGRIRLGHKAEYTRKDGSKGERPTADPFFNLPPELAEVYDQQPATLHIRFLSDDLETTFPYYLRLYRTSGLACLGDGERILYKVEAQGSGDQEKKVIVVRDGIAVGPDNKFIQEANGGWRYVPCTGENCPQYISGLCKPTGFLRFVVEEKMRQGYYDMVCHQKAVIGIKTQLAMCKQLFGRLTDIPFLLHRGEEEQVAVKTPKGVVNMPVRTQWVEIDPDWFASAFTNRAAIIGESRRLLAPVTKEDIWGAAENGDDVPAIATPVVPAIAAPEFAEALYDDEAEEGAPEDEPVVEVPLKPRVEQLAFVESTAHGGWAAAVVKTASSWGYRDQDAVLKALTEAKWDPAAMDYGHARDILTCLQKRQEATP